MNTEKQRWLAFSLCGEQYAIPLMKVREVIALVDTTPLPQMPSYFKGIMNLRGRIVSVLDLRARFRLNNQECLPESVIIILDVDDADLGVVVDSVDNVLTLNETEIAPPPELNRRDGQAYIIGISKKDQKLVLLLDIEKALSVADLNAINKGLHSHMAA
jgi:purine-binding chemotaxis protein CheW